MKATLDSLNVVVSAHQLNPSIVRESWLIHHGFLKDASELQPGFLFSGQAVFASTARFNLQVLPQQLVFAAADPADPDDTLNSVLAPMLGKLPHTPFRALGLNHIWFLEPETETIEKWSRENFAPSGALAEAFGETDARFGAYMSQDVEGTRTRLKLDVRPIRKVDPSGALGNEALQATFNFHTELPDSPEASEIITRVFDNRQKFGKLAAKIAKSLEGK